MSLSRCASTRRRARMRSRRSSTAACARSGWAARGTRCLMSSPAACANGPALRARWCSSRRFCSSMSLTGHRPGAHRALVRADQGSAFREWRHLCGDHARHPLGAADRKLSRVALAGQGRRAGPGAAALRLRAPLHEPVPRRQPQGSADDGLMIARLFAACARGAVRRPWLTLACASALAICGGALALSLRPSAATSTFLPADSAASRASRALEVRFRGEPIEVLVRGNLQQLLLSGDLERLVGIEGCLAGHLPPAALAKLGSARAPCAALARTRAVQVVIGPGTFINEAVIKIDEALGAIEGRARKAAAKAVAVVEARALASGEGAAEAHKLGEEARSLTMRAYEAELASYALRYGIVSTPAINNAEFVAALVFARGAPAGTPKARFSYLFPSARSALISIRLHAGLSEAAQAHAIALIEAVLHAPAFALEGGSYLLTGEPVLRSEEH